MKPSLRAIRPQRCGCHGTCAECPPGEPGAAPLPQPLAAQASMWCLLLGTSCCPCSVTKSQAPKCDPWDFYSIVTPNYRGRTRSPHSAIRFRLSLGNRAESFGGKGSGVFALEVGVVTRAAGLQMPPGWRWGSWALRAERGCVCAGPVSAWSRLPVVLSTW